MGSIYFVIFILITALCLFLSQRGPGAPSSPPFAPSMHQSPQTPPRRPREKSDVWQKEYPISPHRNLLDTPGTPYRATRRENRVLRNIINAGVHQMDMRHQRRMSRRESAQHAADDSFVASTRKFYDPDMSGYYSDISEVFDPNETFDDVDGAPFLSEEEGDYSQYPILGFDEAESPRAAYMTPRQRALQELQRNKSKTPSKVEEIIEKGSGKTLRGRRRDRLKRQRSRGLQKSTGAIPRRLDFSPYHKPRKPREHSAAVLPKEYDGGRQGFVDPALEKIRQKQKAESDDENAQGVKSVRNYAAQINSRLRGNN